MVVAATDEDPGGVEEATTPDSDGKREGFLMKVARTVHRGRRWCLESDEPDASGRWNPAHRRRMLSCVYRRDGGRCGLCTAKTKIKGAHLEHVVPKVFDVGKNDKAESGTQYKSRLHKIDNLQAAHPYCNKRKGNTAKVDKWRHPGMPPLIVADAADGDAFVLPRNVA